MQQHKRKSVNVEENIPEETIELLEKYRTQFKKQIANGNSRKERIEKLMLRHSAAKWSVEKREKMTRRHLAAIGQVDAAQNILTQVNDRISQLQHQQQNL